jgi:hypothetical protein
MFKRGKIEYRDQVTYSNGRRGARRVAYALDDFSPGYIELMFQRYVREGIVVVQEMLGVKKTQAYEAAASWGWNKRKIENINHLRDLEKEIHNLDHCRKVWGWRDGDFHIDLTHKIRFYHSAIGKVGQVCTPSESVRQFMMNRGLRKIRVTMDGLTRSIPIRGVTPCGNLNFYIRNGKLMLISPDRIFSFDENDDK